MAQLGVDANYETCDFKVATSGVTETVFPAVTTGVLAKPSKIFVQSWSGNTKSIHIGKTGILADGTVGGYELTPGSSMLLPGHIPSDWYHIAGAASQKLFITYLTGVY